MRAGNQATLTYNLNWTGTLGASGGGQLPSIAGLYDYLVRTGLGVPIGENVWEASPGDIVLMDTSATPGPGYREHAMVIVSTFYSGWTGSGRYPTRGYEALLDGHNVAAYHNFMRSWVGPGYGLQSFEIIHMRGHHQVMPRGVSLLHWPSGWGRAVDANGMPLWYTPTTKTASSGERWADATIAAPGSCAIALYLPKKDATMGDVYVRVKTSDGVWHVFLVDENNPGAYDFAVPGGALPGTPVEAFISNLANATGYDLGIGDNFYFFC